MAIVRGATPLVVEQKKQLGTRTIHRRHSVESLAVDLGCRMVLKNAVRAWAIQPNLRWPLGSIDWAAGLVSAPRSAKLRRIRLPHCQAELISAANSRARRAVLYLHGGAFLTCGLNTHRSLVTRLSDVSDAVILNVGYRMLPAFGLTDSIQDALDGLHWLRRNGYDWPSIAVAGDSAGGYLALVTTPELIRSFGRSPAGVATISPLTDLDPKRKLAHRNARRCAMFTGSALTMFNEYLTRRGLNPRLAQSRPVPPVDADLTRMPPVTIHASTDELLLADAELMYRRLGRAGIRCDLHLWRGQIHDFPLAADVLPEGRRALRYLGDFVKEVTVPTMAQVA